MTSLRSLSYLTSIYLIFSFLEQQESLTERRLTELNSILDCPTSCLPDHITVTLNSLRSDDATEPGC